MPDTLPDEGAMGRAGAPRLAARPVAPPPEDYIPLPVENLVPGLETPFEVFLRTRIGAADDDRFVSCSPAGRRLEAMWPAIMRATGVTRVYIRQRDLQRVLDYLDRNLAAFLSDPGLSAREKARRVCDIAGLWMRRFFAASEIQTASHLARGFGYVDRLLEQVQEDHYYRGWLMNLYSHGQDLYAHSLNTSLLGSAFARRLGWDERVVREVARSALMHDIGMTRVPAAILAKKGALTEDEMDMVKKHPRTGFLLLKTLSLMSPNALSLVAQHHENGDGSGYPDGLTLEKIHPLGRMMRIVDSFEALVSPRCWRDPYPPAKALWILRHNWQQRGVYDAGLLSEFIRFVAGGTYDAEGPAPGAGGPPKTPPP